MNFENETIVAQDRISINNLLPEIGLKDIRKEIITGLQSEQKHISSKFFYNERGSKLFEEITKLDEYYPTRTEISILENIAPDLLNRYSGFDIVELGSGDPTKISILLSSVGRSPTKYIPVDVSESAILSSAEILLGNFPGMTIKAYVVDFIKQFKQIKNEAPMLICFFGSTIGNFDRVNAMDFLKSVSHSMKKGDALLLGMDMVKPEPVLHAAYNDSKGVTAEFNKNIFNSVNNIINSDFNTENFEHLAFFNSDLSRIEMHLIAKKSHTVNSQEFEFPINIKKGEHIHTENSHKYKASDILEISHATSLKTKNVFSDKNKWFSLVEFVKE